MKSDSRVGWGNKFGVMLLPFYLGKRLADPIQHLRKLKEMTCTKKLSLEAIFSLKGYTFVKAVLGGKVRVCTFVCLFVCFRSFFVKADWICRLRQK